MQTRSFAGKVAAITGAGSGIGRALALNLSKRGCALALSDISERGLAETAALVSTKCTSRLLDVTRAEDVRAWAAEVVRDHGKVNLIFNNAGIGYAATVDGGDDAEFARVIDVDFWGVVNGTRAFLPLLLASGDGHAINISSLFGLIAFPGNSAYNAAKFAVRGFTEALRQEMLVAKHPVKVTCVHPGGIKTAVARNATVADGQDAQSFAEFFDKHMAIHSPEMAAATIIGAVVKGRARVVIGWEAKALDVLARTIGPAYQRVIALAVSKFFPWA
jgi:NAD(P)-dependent dehydrogenase (short-subunit alcohol dehydrogenase family)